MSNLEKPIIPPAGSESAEDERRPEQEPKLRAVVVYLSHGFRDGSKVQDKIPVLYSRADAAEQDRLFQQDIPDLLRQDPRIEAAAAVDYGQVQDMSFFLDDLLERNQTPPQLFYVESMQLPFTPYYRDAVPEIRGWYQAHALPKPVVILLKHHTELEYLDVFYHHRTDLSFIPEVEIDLSREEDDFSRNTEQERQLHFLSRDEVGRLLQRATGQARVIWKERGSHDDSPQHRSFYDSQAGAAFDQRAEQTAETTTELEMIESVFRQAPYLIPRGRVLEIGSGQGRISLRLAEEGYDVVSLDLASKPLEIAQERSRGQEAPPLFIQGDARRLPIRNGAVDACLMPWHVFGELTKEDDRTAVLQEINRVLPEQGLLIFDLPHPDNPEYQEKIGEFTAAHAEDADFRTGTYEYLDEAGHPMRARVYQKEEIRELLEKYGFIVAEEGQISGIREWQTKEGVRKLTVVAVADKMYQALKGGITLDPQWVQD